MSGPFRFEPPAWRDDLLDRSRLLDRMAQRWSRRLVTVVAGPGFGKSALLVAAMTRDQGIGVDTWLACEPRDADAAVLLADLSIALGVAGGATVDDLVAAVWMRAPTPVCLVIDDVHEVPPDSSGAELIARLVAELPGNAHVVLSSRASVPVPLGRLAARGDLERIVESDLAFDDRELAAFASARGVDVQVLSSSGGWPAIAELAATAGADLVDEYLWEEVLGGIGTDRAHDLARFAAAGGGDDAIAGAVARQARGTDDLVAGVPLVSRSVDGWVTLHPLWIPALRRNLPGEEADECRRLAANVHRDAGRHDAAITLFVEAQAWEEVLATIRRAELEPWSRGDALLFGRWHRLLPPAARLEPPGRFAAAIELAARRPLAAGDALRDAAAAFRAAGDIDGEVAVICHDGLIRWWANDVEGLAELFERVVVLAAGGSPEANTLMSIGLAAIAHIDADSPGVLAALSSVDCELLDPGWLASVEWLRHVAYRRAGDLDLADVVLDRTTARSSVAPNSETTLARLQIAWLRGHVEEVRSQLPLLEVEHRGAGNHYLHVEVSLELGAHLAWLGDLERARELLAETAHTMAEMPGALTKILRLAAVAAVAVNEGDEAAAAAALAADPHARAGRPDNWYWRDRALVALPWLLLPGERAAWDEHTTHPVHRLGLELARLLADVRAGDLSGVAKLRWPQPGLVRAHLPVRWIEELVVAASSVGNPPPVSLGNVPRSGEAPTHRVRIGVLGPLEVRLDGTVVDDPDLRRRRVQELLCLLVIRRRVRREAIAEELWPDVHDPRHNLRVTLNYLRRVLEPGRDRRDPSPLLGTGHHTITLFESDALRCDLWELDAHLDAAVQAERNGDPRRALDSYLAALPLWRGPAFADLVDADWARDEQTRALTRYHRAAVRAGDLLLADGRSDEAVRAGEYATFADPAGESGYGVIARAHIAAGDLQHARRALDACARALSEIDASPGDEILELGAELDRRMRSLTIR